MRKFSFDAKKTVRGKFKPSNAAEQALVKQLKKVAQVSGHIIEFHSTGEVFIENQKAMMDQLTKYSERLEPWARRQAKKMIETVKNSNKRAYQNKSKAIGTALKLNVGELRVESKALELINEQVVLIKSIPIEAGLRAQRIAYAAALNGTRAIPNAQLVKEITEQRLGQIFMYNEFANLSGEKEFEEEMARTTEVATNRAILIARTETARANAVINQTRAQAVGSGQYRWHNSGDEAVRHSHKYINGKKLQGMIFSWDDPPTLDDGMTGHPGTFPNCRCFAEPVFEIE